MGTRVQVEVGIYNRAKIKDNCRRGWVKFARVGNQLPVKAQIIGDLFDSTMPFNISLSGCILKFLDN